MRVLDSVDYFTDNGSYPLTETEYRKPGMADLIPEGWIQAVVTKENFLRPLTSAGRGK